MKTSVERRLTNYLSSEEGERAEDEEQMKTTVFIPFYVISFVTLVTPVREKMSPPTHTVGRAVCITSVANDWTSSVKGC